MLDENITKSRLLDTFDRLEGRVELLPGEQQAFVRLFQSVQSFKYIAQAVKIHQGTVARRLKKIAKRISDDKFVRAIIESQNGKIIKEKFINGKSVNQIAIETRLSKYEVKKVMNNIANTK
jgi:DNA invertase Pin-like site-specific DNA recombinase